MLTPEEIQKFRVEYGDDSLARLEQAIDDAPPDGKVVFAGHRGCGKSTLLFPLTKGELEGVLTSAETYPSRVEGRMIAVIPF